MPRAPAFVGRPSSPILSALVATTPNRPVRTKPKAPKPASPKAAEPAALAPVAPDSSSGLSPTDHAVLAEAITRAETVRATIDSTWTDFGRWLFAHVFGEDTASAIEHREDNPIWAALYALADGPKVRLRHDDIDRAVLCAAYDKRLNSDAWRALDFGRKWRLLRLEDDKLMAKAAKHVLATNLDTRKVDAYVRNVLAEQDVEIPTRVNVPAFVGQLGRFHERVSTKAFARQLESAANKLTDEQREKLLETLDQTRATLDALRARLKAR
jgi:hypothetical protein